MYLTFLTACLVASLIGWSIATGFILIPVIAIPLGIIVILACRQQVNIILRDDRVQEIHALAALRALEICIIIFAIGAVILCSYVISDPLSPTVNGRYISNDDGTRSMEITMYRPQFPGNSEHIIRSTTIHNIDAMNEFEAMEYCQFRRESFQDNEQKAIAGMTLASGAILLLALFGAFIFYYNRKY
ncbi:MAG: DUF2178 domain-containing protein [Methanospirillum sp.]|nr:DUF2178 domain-containing protein [Methanospirillum sp.]